MLGVGPLLASKPVSAIMFVTLLPLTFLLNSHPKLVLIILFCLGTLTFRQHLDTFLPVLLLNPLLISFHSDFLVELRALYSVGKEHCVHFFY